MFKVLPRPADEPPPRITRWGLHSYFLLWIFMPLFVAASLAGFRGLCCWKYQAMRIVLGIVFIWMVPLKWIFARQGWGEIFWIWLGSLFLVIVYSVLLVAADGAFNYYDDSTPREINSASALLVIHLLLMPLLWNVVRLLMNPYFQPWTTPDQWEYGAYETSAIDRFLYPEVARERDLKQEEYVRRKCGTGPGAKVAPAAKRSFLAPAIIAIWTIPLMFTLITLITLITLLMR